VLPRATVRGHYRVGIGTIGGIGPDSMVPMIPMPWTVSSRQGMVRKGTLGDGMREGRTSRERVGRVKVAMGAAELRPRAVFAGDHPEPVMLELVQPRVAGRRLRRFSGQAWWDEAERERRHVRCV
jgi:hypothetical protein